MYNIVDFVEDDESDYRVNHDDFLNKYQDRLIFLQYVYQKQDDQFGYEHLHNGHYRHQVICDDYE